LLSPNAFRSRSTAVSTAWGSLALPGKIRRNVLRMLEFFTTYLQSGQTKPSSLDQLVALGARPLPDQRESLRNTLQYWAAQSGYGQAETGQAA